MPDPGWTKKIRRRFRRSIRVPPVSHHLALATHKDAAALAAGTLRSRGQASRRCIGRGPKLHRVWTRLTTQRAPSVSALAQRRHCHRLLLILGFCTETVRHHGWQEAQCEHRRRLGRRRGTGPDGAQEEQECRGGRAPAGQGRRRQPVLGGTSRTGPRPRRGWQLTRVLVLSSPTSDGLACPSSKTCASSMCASTTTRTARCFLGKR